MILGLDISLNHFGLVCLDPFGSFVQAAYLTDLKKYVNLKIKCLKEVVSILLPKKERDENNEDYAWRRLCFVVDCLNNLLNSFAIGEKNSYVCIEGYSFSSQSQSIFQIAELVGVIKYNVFGWRSESF